MLGEREIPISKSVINPKAGGTIFIALLKKIK